MSEKINRKKLEHLKRIRLKNEAKNTKSKIKKMAKIIERKKLKQTVLFFLIYYFKIKFFCFSVILC